MTAYFVMVLKFQNSLTLNFSVGIKRIRKMREKWIARIFVIGPLLSFLMACAPNPVLPDNKPFHSFSVAVRGFSSDDAKALMASIKQGSSAREVDVVQLQNRYAEYRYVTAQDSSEFYDSVAKAVRSAGQVADVSYAADHFSVKRKE